MSKQWINTSVEYQWSDELNKLVQISKEGYWYEGELALAGTTTYSSTGDEWVYISADTDNSGEDDNPYLALRQDGGIVGMTLGCVGNHNNQFTNAFDNANYIFCGVNWPTEFQIAHGQWGSGTATDTWVALHIGIGASGGGGKTYVGLGMNNINPLDQIHAKNSVNYGPTLRLEHTGSDQGGGLRMISTGTQADDDRIGHLQWDAKNSASENIRYAEINAYSTDVTDATEDGKLTFSTYVAGTNAERISIVGGNVGIGDTSPSYKLEVAGTFYSSGSSIEYKQDVEPYTPPEGALMSLKPVQYDYKDEWKNFGKRYAGNSSKQLGFVAEDVAKILPELAVTKSEDGKEVVRNVDYEKLTVLLVSEVQSLRKEINDLRRSSEID